METLTSRSAPVLKRTKSLAGKNGPKSMGLMRNMSFDLGGSSKKIKRTSSKLLDASSKLMGSSSKKLDNSSSLVQVVQPLSRGVRRTSSGSALSSMRAAAMNSMKRATLGGSRRRLTSHSSSGVATDEPMNIFASDMVSSDFILGHLHDVESQIDIVKIEIEDLIISSHRELLIPKVKSILMAKDREWVTVNFVDSLPADQFKTWQALKKDIMADFEDLLEETMNSDSIITIQANVEVGTGTSLRAFMSLLRSIRRHRGVCNVEFAGALFGYSEESLVEGLDGCMDEDNILSETICIKVACGWRVEESWARQLDACIRAGKDLADFRRAKASGEDLPAMRRVRSAGASLDLLVGGDSSAPKNHRRRSARNLAALMRSEDRSPTRSGSKPTGDDEDSSTGQRESDIVDLGGPSRRSGGRRLAPRRHKSGPVRRRPLIEETTEADGVNLEESSPPFAERPILRRNQSGPVSTKRPILRRNQSGPISKRGSSTLLCTNDNNNGRSENAPPGERPLRQRCLSSDDLPVPNRRIPRVSRSGRKKSISGNLGEIALDSGATSDHTKHENEVGQGAVESLGKGDTVSSEEEEESNEVIEADKASPNKRGNNFGAQGKPTPVAGSNRTAAKRELIDRFVGKLKAGNDVQTASQSLISQLGANLQKEAGDTGTPNCSDQDRRRQVSSTLGPDFQWNKAINAFGPDYQWNKVVGPMDDSRMTTSRASHDIGASCGGSIDDSCIDYSMMDASNVSVLGKSGMDESLVANGHTLSCLKGTRPGGGNPMGLSHIFNDSNNFGLSHVFNDSAGNGMFHDSGAIAGLASLTPGLDKKSDSEANRRTERRKKREERIVEEEEDEETSTTSDSSDSSSDYSSRRINCEDDGPANEYYDWTLRKPASARDLLGLQKGGVRGDDTNKRRVSRAKSARSVCTHESSSRSQGDFRRRVGASRSLGGKNTALAAMADYARSTKAKTSAARSLMVSVDSVNTKTTKETSAMPKRTSAGQLSGENAFEHLLPSLRKIRSDGGNNIRRQQSKEDSGVPKHLWRRRASDAMES